MVEVLQQLVDAVNKLNGFSWSEGVAILSLLSSWITIWFLLRDHIAENRPYIQVSFELIRSNLACVVIRNTGKVPVSLCNITFDKDFIKQLPDSEEKRLFENGITDMKIFPDKYWVMCLGVIVPKILEYENTVLKVDFSYRRIGRRKEYKESTIVDFKQYAKCLVYISEIDELREVDKRMASDVADLKKIVKEIKAVVTKYQYLSDRTERSIVLGYKVREEELTKAEQNKTNSLDCD